MKPAAENNPGIYVVILSAAVSQMKLHIGWERHEEIGSVIKGRDDDRLLCVAPRAWARMSLAHHCCTGVYLCYLGWAEINKQATQIIR